MSGFKNFNIDELKEFYGKRYRRIINGLDRLGATDYEVDTSCGIWLELWCSIKGKRIKVNIGIDDMYHLWLDVEGIPSLHLKTQDELVYALWKEFA